MGTAHTLSRRFFWAENNLWKEDIQGHPVTVVLAGRDVIVNTKVIGTYLTGAKDWLMKARDGGSGIWKGNGLSVLWFEDLNHGQVFDLRTTRRRLVDIVHRLSIER